MRPIAERVVALYYAFNARELETVLAQLSEEVDWPNAREGGRLRGRDAVREYWLRQWSETDPTVQPKAVDELPGGRIAVDVHQTVRALDGTVLAENDVRHVYRLDGELVVRMDIEEEPAS